MGLRSGMRARMRAGTCTAMVDWGMRRAALSELSDDGSGVGVGAADGGVEEATKHGGHVVVVPEQARTRSCIACPPYPHPLTTSRARNAYLTHVHALTPRGWKSLDFPKRFRMTPSTLGIPVRTVRRRVCAVGESSGCSANCCSWSS